MENIITINQLTKSFKKTSVIENLSHNFKAGERIALVGQNGAGKTTLIRSILGLYDYDGSIDVMGMNPRTERENILHHIGFVPQIPPPIKMTVGEMLEFFGTLTNTDEQEFITISEKLGLDVQANLDKPFMKLSGGMKQKLLVSFALGRKPKILLMDEPAANLDPKARLILFDYLHKFDKDALMIISSHRIDEVEGLVNRLIEMDMGKIIIDKEV
ncbi:MAG TPA: ABC transporter ATP-binding protein [Lutibacter sp.]|nr:ABC transporter ATP-binding protein [Lutibacter sp.]